MVLLGYPPMSDNTLELSGESVAELNKACGLLSDALKKARAAGKETGNPFTPFIEETFEIKKQALLEAPLLYQAIFLSAASSPEDVIKMIHDIKTKLEA